MKLSGILGSFPPTTYQHFALSEKLVWVGGRRPDHFQVFQTSFRNKREWEVYNWCENYSILNNFINSHANISLNLILKMRASKTRKLLITIRKTSMASLSLKVEINATNHVCGAKIGWGCENCLWTTHKNLMSTSQVLLISVSTWRTTISKNYYLITRNFSLRFRVPSLHEYKCFNNSIQRFLLSINS